MRRFNLSAVLAEIHDRGPMTRAELMEILELGRTTVFDLLVQLFDLGLIEDAATRQRAGVGRPSLRVRASDSVAAYVVNPELDALAVGIVTLGGELVIRRCRWTPLDPSDTAALAATWLAELHDELGRELRVTGVGAGVPGPIAADSGRVMAAPSLGWTEVDFAGLLSSRLRLPAQVQNNARLVTLAEHRMGNARDCEDFVYLFAGAGGIGGGIVSAGHILGGKGGFAGEIGHMIVGMPSSGGSGDSLESSVRREDLLAVLGVAEADDAELEALVAACDDPRLEIVAAGQLRSVGVALANLANALDTRMLLLGGFLGALQRRFPDHLERSVRSTVLPAIGASLEIRTTSDTVERLLRGAAELAFADLIADPMAWSRPAD